MDWESEIDTPKLAPVKASWDDEDDIEGYEPEPAPSKPVAPSVVQPANPLPAQAVWGRAQGTAAVTEASRPWRPQSVVEPVVVVKAQPAAANSKAVLLTPAQKAQARQAAKGVALPEQVIKGPKVKKGPPRAIEIQEVLTEQKIETPILTQVATREEGEEKSKQSDLVVLKELFSTADEIQMRKIEKERDTEILRTLEPTTDKDFVVLAKAIATRVEPYSSSSHYRNFVKDLTKQLTDPLTPDDMNDVVHGLNAIINEKLKASKLSKGKPKRAPKVKLNITKGSEAEVDENYDAIGEYDDFM